MWTLVWVQPPRYAKHPADLDVFGLIEYIGLYDFLNQSKASGTLNDLRGEDGFVHSVFICCDLPYQYLDDYFTKLGPEYFHELKNKVSSSL
jgi:hypothetical protein